MLIYWVCEFRFSLFICLDLASLMMITSRTSTELRKNRYFSCNDKD